jgi:diacylglycerol kinase (ATP)
MPNTASEHPPDAAHRSSIVHECPAPQAPAKTVVTSFGHALDGLVHAFRTQRHMRFHLVIIVIVMSAALFLRVSPAEILILFFSIALVLVTELLNTAAEMSVGLVVQKYHPWARIIKDVAAGSVLVAAANAVGVGAVVFLRRQRWEERVADLLAGIAPQGPDAIIIMAIGIALLAVVVIVLKAWGRRGRILAGGVISGHSAIAFFLATSIAFFTGSYAAGVLAYGLAVLISQSRVEGAIHTTGEAVLGGAIGVLIGVIVFMLGRLL